MIMKLVKILALSVALFGVTACNSAPDSSSKSTQAKREVLTSVQLWEFVKI